MSIGVEISGKFVGCKSRFYVQADSFALLVKWKFSGLAIKTCKRFFSHVNCTGNKFRTLLVSKRLNFHFTEKALCEKKYKTGFRHMLDFWEFFAFFNGLWELFKK
jgi:hypothetical protein